MEEYLYWISKPEVQESILKALDKMGKLGSISDPHLGICGNLAGALELSGLEFNYQHPYDFVSNHSDGYWDFCNPESPAAVEWGKWGGEAGAFRREWCRNMAAALRADQWLWLKVR